MRKYRRNQVTCNCEAYPFPHRLDGGKCRELYNEKEEVEYRERDSLDSLGLRSLFAPDNRETLRF